MPLRVVAGPDYWATHAEMRRRAWAAEDAAAEAVRRELRRRVRPRGAAKRVAHDLGIGCSTLRNIVKGRVRPTRLMMERLNSRERE
jgi:hypothetical protein